MEFIKIPKFNALFSLLLLVITIYLYVRRVEQDARSCVIEATTEAVKLEILLGLSEGSTRVAIPDLTQVKEIHQSIMRKLEVCSR